MSPAKARDDRQLEKAYWRSFYQLLGPQSGEILRSVLAPEVEPEKDWRLVHEHLARVDRTLAVMIEEAAERDLRRSREHKKTQPHTGR